jgi:hypothetical protein
MRLTGSLTRCGVAVLLAVGACLAQPTGATARDVCPTLFTASVLPDQSSAVEISAGEPLAAARKRLVQLQSQIDSGSRVTRIRQIPDPLPVDVDQAWVLQFGYAPDLNRPRDSAGFFYEAILCVGTKVPLSVGTTVRQTMAALKSRALVSESAVDSDWSVQSLDPMPDELVEFGSSVKIVAQPPSQARPTQPTDEPSSPQPRTVEPSTQAPSTQTPSTLAGDDGPQRTGSEWAPWTWPVLGLVLVVAVAVAAWARHRTRRSARSRTRDPQVTARVHEDAPHTEVREFPGVQPSHTVRIEAHRAVPDITILPAGGDGAAGDDGDPTADDLDGPERR